VKDCDHQIGADRDPDLGLYRVGARAVVMLDSQVAFDPSKEQLDALSQLVEHGNRQSRNFQVVDQEDQLFAGFRIVVSDFPKEDVILPVWKVPSHGKAPRSPISGI